jgi:hypothetical protein
MTWVIDWRYILIFIRLFILLTSGECAFYYSLWLTKVHQFNKSNPESRTLLEPLLLGISTVKTGITFWSFYALIWGRSLNTDPFQLPSLLLPLSIIITGIMLHLISYFKVLKSYNNYRIVVEILGRCALCLVGTVIFYNFRY